MSAVREAARAMLGSIFVTQGAQAVLNPDRVVPVAQRVTDRITPVLERTSPRLPTDPRRLVQLNGAIHLGAGLLLLTPLRRPAAAALAASLVPTTLAGHSFWLHDDAGERAGQRINFLKNLGLMGGLLLAAADTEGRPGLRWRTRHLTQLAGGAAAGAATRATTRATAGAAKSATKSAAKGAAKKSAGKSAGWPAGRIGQSMASGAKRAKTAGRAKTAARGKAGGPFARAAGKHGGWLGHNGHRSGRARWTFAR